MKRIKKFTYYSVRILIKKTKGLYAFKDADIIEKSELFYRHSQIERQIVILFLLTADIPEKVLKAASQSER